MLVAVSLQQFASDRTLTVPQTATSCRRRRNKVFVVVVVIVVNKP